MNIHSPAPETESSSDPARSLPPLDARQLRRSLSRYREPSAGRSAFELVITLVPLLLLWAGMALALHLGYHWLYLLLILPAAGFLLRLFMIQHDCGHGSFFRARWMNDWLGRIIGPLTLTPYGYWRRTHAEHHASAGNLDRRGMGDVTTLTVAEYVALAPWGRLRYRLYRHPLVVFGLGPFYLFFLQNRLPIGLMRAGPAPWISTLGTSAATLLAGSLASWFVGPSTVLLIYVPVALVAGTIGVWLFYVQHQFEETLWQSGQAWSAEETALYGSSHYDLPPVLRWFTANIGIHHVHHLASRIPSYRLPQVVRDFPALKHTSRLTLADSFRAVRLVLWDEERLRLVSFAEAAR